MNVQEVRELQETRRNMPAILKATAFVAVIFGILFVCLLFHNAPKEILDRSITPQQRQSIKENYFELNGNIGGFVGGVVGTLFSLAGFFLIYLTFTNQKESFEQDKIESRFFNLINLHRSNVDELIYRNGRTNETLATGRRVFKEIYDQIGDALRVTDYLFRAFPPETLLRNEVKSQIPAELMVDYAKISVSYAIVFFGVAKDNDNSTLNALSKDFDLEISKKIIQFFKLIPAKYELEEREDWEKIVKANLLLDKNIVKMLFDDTVYQISLNKCGYELGALTFTGNYEFVNLIKRIKIFNKRFGGHQYKLGHYYRHIFQTVNFIDKQHLLTYDEKYEYVKTLRAQLSNYEQYVFFFNSVSYVGRKWELAHNNTPEKWLISKYNLIKNIPDIGANAIEIRKFYPVIDYEFEDSCPKRKSYKERYWA